MTRTTPRNLLALAAAAVAVFVGYWSASGDDRTNAAPVRASQPIFNDPARVLGPEGHDNACIDCHQYEARVWRRTMHATGVDEMHRSAAGERIAAAMGLRSIKRAELCQECHYTVRKTASSPSAMWGVSCESCHGAAKEWIEVHYRVGGDPTARGMTVGGTREVETDEQRAQRLIASAERGMAHSGMLATLARRCLDCHLIADAKLVNVGGHPTGERAGQPGEGAGGAGDAVAPFELVAWFEGEVHHRFASSAERGRNAEATPAMRRKMYVIGALTDLEMTLRKLAARSGEAGANQAIDGRLRDALVTRANRLRRAADRITQAADLPAIKAALAALPGEVSATTAVDIAACDALARATDAFDAENSGENLAALDPLLPKRESYRGKPYQP